MTKKTFRYFISAVLLLLASIVVDAQDAIGRKHFLRINVDLASPTYSYFFDKNRIGYEAMAEYSYNDTLFFVAEGGYHQLIDTLSTSYQSASNGAFLRLGVNRNMMKYYNKRDRDIFYVGARLSGSLYNTNYSFINVKDSYWGNVSLSPPPTKTYMGFWGEVVVGMRIETLKNLFIGWDIRGSFKLYDTNQSTYKTLFIPGYGNAQSSVSLWMNYSVGYAF
ncbi:MAG: DUF6048 family protein [Bacteroidetes bacterium]|nr:DUF6048 family protein [Bacteroidota bacterium]